LLVTGLGAAGAGTPQTDVESCLTVARTLAGGALTDLAPLLASDAAGLEAANLTGAAELLAYAELLDLAFARAELVLHHLASLAEAALALPADAVKVASALRERGAAHGLAPDVISSLLEHLEAAG
jgi:hypothetical protein